AALNHAFETALAQNKSATEAGAIAVGGLMELATQQRQAAAHAEQERIMLGRSKVKIATSHPLREGDEGKVQDIIAGGHFGIPGMAGDWSVIKRKEIVIEAADLQLPPHLEDAARERGLGLRRRLFGDTSR
ncbi:MAG: hypothetical protein EBZ69_08820, partial [Alphaproteobacteria bacterium]|nr:hypothetical protein [Alphaproteobacteria bacterium]